MNVGVVDFKSPSAPQDFTKSLKETGFAVLVNHPFEQSSITAIYDEWAGFFADENKHTYACDPVDQNGYFAPNVSETAKGYTVKDIKEFFHYYPWCRYPATLSDATKEYATKATQVAQTLLGWVEANTPESVSSTFSQPLSSMIENSTRTLLRVLNYPPLTGNEPEGAVRAAAHEDINLLTLLPASNEPGLQVLDLLGNWHDVPCDFGSIAVNAGDMLQYASGGYYPSTTHRVVNPTGDAAKRARLSMPLFLHPADDVILANERTAFSFLNERIATLRGEPLKSTP